MNSAQKEAHARMLSILPVRSHIRPMPIERKRLSFSEQRTTLSQRAEMRALRKKGWALKDIAAKLGVSTATVGNHLNGRYRTK